VHPFVDAIGRRWPPSAALFGVPRLRIDSGDSLVFCAIEVGEDVFRRLLCKKIFTCAQFGS
jgi:hypothetical protein